MKRRLAIRLEGIVDMHVAAAKADMELAMELYSLAERGREEREVFERGWEERWSGFREKEREREKERVKANANATVKGKKGKKKTGGEDNEESSEEREKEMKREEEEDRQAMKKRLEDDRDALVGLHKERLETIQRDAEEKRKRAVDSLFSTHQRGSPPSSSPEGDALPLALPKEQVDGATRALRGRLGGVREGFRFDDAEEMDDDLDAEGEGAVSLGKSNWRTEGMGTKPSPLMSRGGVEDTQKDPRTTPIARKSIALGDAGDDDPVSFFFGVHFRPSDRFRRWGWVLLLLLRRRHRREGGKSRLLLRNRPKVRYSLEVEVVRVRLKHNQNHNHKEEPRRKGGANPNLPVSFGSLAVTTSTKMRMRMTRTRTSWERMETRTKKRIGVWTLEMLRRLDWRS